MDISGIKDLPPMKEILIRDLPKTEREWILVYALYSSNIGKSTFTREDIFGKYEDSNRKTESRVKNLTNNLNSIIKSGQIKYVNDSNMLLTPSGVQIAKEILDR